ncbi:helix-turn-helix domain-containing protein [Ahniella affigens]|nr:AraC family transcriptional regulator [Ahniella affigens]
MMPPTTANGTRMFETCRAHPAQLGYVRVGLCGPSPCRKRYESMGSTHSFELASVETLLFEGGGFAVAGFRCPATHPHFAGASNLRNFCFGLPRRSSRLTVNDGPCFVADRNTLVLLNAGDSYARQRCGSDRDDTDVVGISSDVLTDIVKHVAPDTLQRFGGPRFPCNDVTMPPSLYFQGRLTFERLRNTHVHKLAAEVRLLELAGNVVATAANAAGAQIDGGFRRELAGRRAREAVRQVKELMCHSVPQCVDLKSLSDAVHMSQFHLCRLFKLDTGTSIHKYWRQLVLAQSLAMLSCRSIDISGIALSLGFAAQSHFTTAFRQYFGVTPGQYRRVNMNGPGSLDEALGSG